MPIASCVRNKDEDEEDLFGEEEDAEEFFKEPRFGLTAWIVSKNIGESIFAWISRRRLIFSDKSARTRIGRFPGSSAILV